MSEQAAPPAKELRGYVTLTLPITLIQRLQPFTSRRARSKFVEQALTAALDQADQDRERAAV
jgi:hypothetical protein